MVLLISLHYPSLSQRNEFARNAPDSLVEDLMGRRMNHPNLLVDSDNEQWKTAVQTIRENLEDDSMLHDKTLRRPVRPDRVNYAAFQGKRWNPKSSPMEMRGLPSPDVALAGFFGDPSHNKQDTMIHVHYDRCANCTEPATNLCSKCRIVKYCSRKCQSAHWKKAHKESCIEAEPMSLLEILEWNGETRAFHVSPQECRAFYTALSKGQQNSDSGGTDDDSICYFKTYFGLASELGGCFVV